MPGHTLTPAPLAPQAAKPQQPPAPSPYAPPVQTSDFDLVAQDVSDRMEEPSPDPFADPFGGGDLSYQSPVYPEEGEERDPMSQPIFPPDEPTTEPAVAPAPEPVASEAMPHAPVEGEIVEEPLPPESEELQALAMEGSFVDRLEKLLHEANLTPRHLKFCCLGVVLVALIIVAGWFLVPRLLSLFEGEELPTQPLPPEPLDTGGWVDPSVFIGLLLGNPQQILPGDTGVSSGILIGEEEKLAYDFSQIQRFTADLEQLYRLYQSDVRAMLDTSNNRTVTLNQYLVDLRALYNHNFANYGEIGRIKDAFGARFNTLQPQKEASEVEFFTQVRGFNGAAAEKELLHFIELSQKQVDDKAKYFAFSKLESMYEVILPPFKKRIEDIELNREALLSGVQVVDVQGSDLNLIVGEEEL